MKMLKEVWLAFATALAFTPAGAVVPTESECKAVMDKVSELTEDDYAAQKAGKRTRAELGDALLGYVSPEDKSAVKFVLYKKAYEQYVLGMAFDKADDIYGTAQSEEGTEYAQAIAAPMTQKLSGLATSKRPAAKALKTRIANDAQTMKRVMAAKAQLDRDPANEKLCERLAIEYIALGDWESALASCQAVSGKLGKIAEWELSKTRNSDFTSDQVAAFWWSFADGYAKQKRVACQIKSHAAMWYQVAIEEGKFTGVDEKLAIKRMAEAQTTIEDEKKAGRAVAMGSRDAKLPGLVAHFGFDGNLREDVSRATWKTGEKVKWCADQRGRAMSAIVLDGDTILENDKSFIAIEKQMTIAAWVKPEGKIERFVRQSGHGADGCGVRGPALITAVNQYEDWKLANQGVLVGENGIVVVEHGRCHLPAQIVYEKELGKKWMHIAITIEKDKEPMLYLNGKKVAQGAKSERMPILRLGKVDERARGDRDHAVLGGSVCGMKPFVGEVANLSVYNRVLTPAEIMRLCAN